MSDRNIFINDRDGKVVLRTPPLPGQAERQICHPADVTQLAGDVPSSARPEQRGDDLCAKNLQNDDVEMGVVNEEEEEEVEQEDVELKALYIICFEAKLAGVGDPYTWALLEHRKRRRTGSGRGRS